MASIYIDHKGHMIKISDGKYIWRRHAYYWTKITAITGLVFLLISCIGISVSTKSGEILNYVALGAFFGAVCSFFLNVLNVFEDQIPAYQIWPDKQTPQYSEITGDPGEDSAALAKVITEVKNELDKRDLSDRKLETIVNEAVK